jgi:hypothetical protein
MGGETTIPRATCVRARRGKLWGRVSVKMSGPGIRDCSVSGPSRHFAALRHLARVLLFRAQEDSMLQLLDLAKENAELKRELTRVRLEAEALQRLLADSSVQGPSGTSEDDLREIAM